MPPSEYSLRLQKGITGGFAPPTPHAIFTVTRAGDGADLHVSRATREIGTSSLQDLAPKFIKTSEAETLVDELHGILKDLPTENPPGSEDIYGLDTSIAWGSDDLQWCNGGPQGCGGGKSQVQVSKEQKAKFQRAVEIVEELAK